MNLHLIITANTKLNMDRENLSEIQNKTVLLLGFWKSAYQFMATERSDVVGFVVVCGSKWHPFIIELMAIAHRSNRTTYAWVLNCILATSGACSTKVLLDPLKAFFEYAKIEQMEERLCCQGSSGCKISTCWPREDLLFDQLKNLPNFSFLLTKERDEKSKIDCLGYICYYFFGLCTASPSPQIFSEGRGRLNTGYYFYMSFFWCLCVSLSSLLYFPTVWKIS